MTVLFLALSRAGWSPPEIPGLWFLFGLFGLDCRLIWFFWPF